jgi:CO/xanthine dehydrogenase Mo-binding subunit
VPGSETATGQVLKGSVTLKECLKEAVEKSGWKSFRDRRSEGRIKRGIGLAASFRGISFGGGSVDTAGALVSIQDDGRALVSCAIREGGQGSETVLRQVCADSLGIPLHRVHFCPWDTHSVPDSGPTVASRGTFVGGNACKQACEQLISELQGVAAEVLGVNPGKVATSEGFFYDKDDPERRIAFEAAVAECRKQGRKLTALGWYKAPGTGIDPQTGQGIPFFDYVYGADVAEVEVDTLSGRVRLLNFTSVHDVGRAVNPGLIEGQICGGVCMGLGTALHEDYELVEGSPGPLNLDQYLLPTAMDMGPVNTVLVEGRLDEGPFGASSVGEPALQIVAPAIINAIAHATGRRIYHLPADLERVFLGRSLSKRAGR